MDEPTKEEEEESEKFIGSLKNIQKAQMNLEKIRKEQEENELLK